MTTIRRDIKNRHVFLAVFLVVFCLCCQRIQLEAETIDNQIDVKKVSRNRCQINSNGSKVDHDCEASSQVVTSSTPANSLWSDFWGGLTSANKNESRRLDEKNMLHVQLGSKLDGMEYPACRRAARCEPLNTTVCFGTALPYKFTSLDLVSVGINATDMKLDIRKQWSFWRRLQNFPKCWAVVQNLICAVFLPRCENNFVDLPNYEMCRVVQAPCRIVASTFGWPGFLQCNHEKNFPKRCKAEGRELRFNITGFCQPPLIAIDAASSWYDYFEGCGLHCHNPFFSEAEHSEIHLFLGMFATACLLTSLFTVLTFFIDWKNANKYPALIIYYVNWCFLISSVGWLAQFTPGARDDIVCRQDRTLRKSEPSSGENLSCVIVFVMVYYFLMAAATWFVMLTYSWYISFKVLGKIRETIEANAAYFHLISWSLPLIFTITILALGQVDGDSVTGICFVGYLNPYARVSFVLFPVLVFLTFGGFYLTRGLIILIKLKIGSENIISAKANSKIRETILRLMGFTLLSVLFVAIAVVCHIYEYYNSHSWTVALQEYIVCKSNMTQLNPEHCQFESRPSILMIKLHLSVLFCAGIMMSSWVWTSSTVDAWKRFLRRVFHQPINEPVKLTKHKLIAKAFAKRHQIRGSRLSFSFQSIHDDPLGMNFDLNSAASQDVSSAWQAALPKFIMRRGAFVGAGALGLRRNSSASEASQRRQSIDSRYSRRLSLDSQISFHMSDQERRAYMIQARQQRRKKRRRLAVGNRRPVKVVPWCSNSQVVDRQQRGSSVSQQSDFGSNVVAAAKINNIEKEAANQFQVANTRNAKLKRFLPFSSLLKHRRKTDGNLAGNRNSGFAGGLVDTSSDGEVMRQTDGCELALPGQICPQRFLSETVRDKSSRLHCDRRGSCGARSIASTDNESIHKLSDQLSNTILNRALRDSQSDVETAGRVGSNRRQQCPRTLEGAKHRLNNAHTSCVGQNTVIDLDSDSDNPESDSS